MAASADAPARLNDTLFAWLSFLPVSHGILRSSNNLTLFTFPVSSDAPAGRAVVTSCMFSCVFMWVVAVFLVMQRNFAAWVSGECLRESKENSFGSHTFMSSFVAQPSDQSVLSAQ